MSVAVGDKKIIIESSPTNFSLLVTLTAKQISGETRDHQTEV